MKRATFITGILSGIILISAATTAHADGTNSPSATPPKPDLLATCPVSGDKLGDMGKPYVFVYQGQEVKLCCPNCKGDFDKDPAKYVKMIRAADKKQSK
jgi:YHS domain-containing protein